MLFPLFSVGLAWKVVASILWSYLIKQGTYIGDPLASLALALRVILHCLIFYLLQVILSTCAMVIRAVWLILPTLALLGFLCPLWVAQNIPIIQHTVCSGSSVLTRTFLPFLRMWCRPFLLWILSWGCRPFLIGHGGAPKLRCPTPREESLLLVAILVIGEEYRSLSLTMLALV